MKLKNILYILTGSFLISSFTSCSDIDENDRWIDAELKVTARNVLIEDFTGQECPNCPKATEMISSMQEQFGHDKIIAVGLHGGPTGVPETNTKKNGLATEEAEEYYKKWAPDAQPQGVINRKGGTLAADKWATAVTECLSIEPHMSIDIVTSYNKDSKEMTAKVKAVSTKSVTGKLQLWITEDNIKGYQRFPNNVRNKEYIHNHIFRASVNGTWGEEFNFKANEAIEKEYTFEIKDNWKAEDIHIVAFVYNDEEGVMQVVRSENK